MKTKLRDLFEKLALAIYDMPLDYRADFSWEKEADALEAALQNLSDVIDELPDTDNDYLDSEEH